MEDDGLTWIRAQQAVRRPPSSSTTCWPSCAGPPVPGRDRGAHPDARSARSYSRRRCSSTLDRRLEAFADAGAAAGLAGRAARDVDSAALASAGRRPLDDAVTFTLQVSLPRRQRGRVPAGRASRRSTLGRRRRSPSSGSTPQVVDPAVAAERRAAPTATAGSCRGSGARRRAWWLLRRRSWRAIAVPPAPARRLRSGPRERPRGSRRRCHTRAGHHRAMAQERRTVHRCGTCGAHGAQVGPGGARPAASGTRWSRRSTAGAAPPGRRRPPRSSPPSSQLDLTECRSARAHRGGRARPGARRRPRARLGHAARRRAGHRQVHAAAAGCRRGWPRAGHGALRLGRGVAASRCGSGPSGSAPCARRLWLAAETRCRDVLGPHRRRSSPTLRGRRLHPDRVRPRARLGAGLGGPGARVRPPARAGGQGARPGRGARRPRHQGRRPRRAPRARARGRHRAVLRGRPPPRPAPAAGASSTASAPPTSSACSR